MSVAIIEEFQSGQMTDLPIVVVIDDGNGYRSLYAHLSAVRVKPGQHVRAGQVIGYEGSTGMSTGCHVHFAVNDNGVWENPRAYLP